MQVMMPFDDLALPTPPFSPPFPPLPLPFPPPATRSHFFLFFLFFTSNSMIRIAKLPFDVLLLHALWDRSLTARSVIYISRTDEVDIM